MTPSDASVIIASIAAIASTINTIITSRVRKDTKEISHAVNNRPNDNFTISDQIDELHRVHIQASKPGGRRHNDPPAT